MKKENLEKMVNETMSCMDAAGRATPAPFLMTRIRAKMQKNTQPSTWERVGIFIARPTVAFPILATVLLMNIYIIRSSVTGSDTSMATQSFQQVSDEYSMNSESSLFDFENIQP